MTTDLSSFDERDFWNLYQALALDPNLDLDNLLKVADCHSRDPLELAYYDFALAIKTYGLCQDRQQFSYACADLVVALIAGKSDYGLSQMYLYKLMDYLEPSLRENTESVKALF